MESSKIVTFINNEFRIFFPYDASLVDGVKALPKRNFCRQGKDAFWAAPCEAANSKPLASFAATYNFVVDDIAAAKLRELNQQLTELEARPNITIEGDFFHIFTVNYRPEVTSVAKGTGVAKWDPTTKTWTLPVQASAVAAVNTLVAVHGLTTESDFAAKVEERNRQIARSIGMSRMDSSDLDIPVPAGLSYLGYQKAGIAYATGKAGVIIGDEPGLGKTIQAIGLSNNDQSIRTVLIIVPASLKTNWLREWQKWCVKGLKVGIVTGGKADQYPTGADVVIINYDLVGKHIETLRATTWDMLVVDEAHNLRNPKTQRTRFILGAKKRTGEYEVHPIPASRLVLLTGTPIVNRPIELWPLVNAVCPDRFNNFFSFAKRYCAAQNNGYGWDFSGSSNLDELQNELRSHCMVRRLKAEVLQDLPAKTRQIIPIQCDAILKTERKSLAAIKANLAKLHAEKTLAYLKGDKEAYQNAVLKLKAASDIAFEDISRVRHTTALAKVPQVVELAQEAVQNGKLLLFGHHQDVLNAYKAAFGDAAIVITGDTPVGKRQELVDRFQNDPSCTVAILSIQAAGVGLTLTAGSHVIFGELDWVPGNMSQAEDRAHRIGQKDNVLVWHIVVEGSLDARMAKKLIAKQAVIDAAMDNPTALESFDVLDNEAVGVDEIALPDFQTIGHAEVMAWFESSEKREKTNKDAVIADRATKRAKDRGFAAEAETMTPEQILAVHRNLKAVAAVCDGAVEQDGYGFNGPDAHVGAALASMPTLEPLQAAFARTMVHKYVGQLGRDAVDAMYQASAAA